MSMAPALSTFSDGDNLQLDVEDYLKWRAKNSHIGVRCDNQDHPQIFVPSEAGQKHPPVHRATRSCTLRAKTSFKFLDLPPELRNLIYDNVFSVDCRHVKPHVYDRKTGCAGVTPTETKICTLKQWLSLPIFRTSRQVRCEALHVFFSCRTWRIPYLPELIPFLNFIGPYCRASLHTLWIEDVFYQGTWSADFIADIVKILNGLGSLRKLYIDFTLHTLAQVPGVLTSPRLAFNISEFKPLLSLRGLTEVKLSFATETQLNTDYSWAGRERAYWATWADDAYSHYFFRRNLLPGKSQKDVAMSFLQDLEAELQQTACLPREAVAEIEHFGSIQWQLCDKDSHVPQPSLLGIEDDAASDEAHTSESEESEDEWLEDSDEDSDVDV